MLVAPSGGDVTVVAQGGEPLVGTDADVCPGEALQPWPVMGAGGHYIYGAEIQDSLGGCEDARYGDADVTASGTNSGWCATDERALADEFAVAKITRMRIGPYADGTTNYCDDLPWELHYEEVEGKTVDVGVPGARRGSVLTPLGIAFADPSEQICEFAETYTARLWQPNFENQSDWETPGVIKGVLKNCEYDFKTAFVSNIGRRRPVTWIPRTGACSFIKIQQMRATYQAQQTYLLLSVPPPPASGLLREDK